MVELFIVTYFSSICRLDTMFKRTRNAAIIEMRKRFENWLGWEEMQDMERERERERIHKYFSLCWVASGGNQGTIPIHLWWLPRFYESHLTVSSIKASSPIFYFIFILLLRSTQVLHKKDSFLKTFLKCIIKSVWHFSQMDTILF